MPLQYVPTDLTEGYPLILPNMQPEAHLWPGVIVPNHKGHIDPPAARKNNDGKINAWGWQFPKPGRALREPVAPVYPENDHRYPFLVGVCRNACNDTRKCQCKIAGACKAGAADKSYGSGRGENVQPHPLLAYDPNCARLYHDIRSNPALSLSDLTYATLSEPATTPPVRELRLWIPQLPQYTIDIVNDRTTPVSVGQVLREIYNQLVLTGITPAEYSQAVSKKAAHRLKEAHIARQDAMPPGQTIKDMRLMRIDWIGGTYRFLGLARDSKLEKKALKKANEFGSNLLLVLK